MNWIPRTCTYFGRNLYRSVSRRFRIIIGKIIYQFFRTDGICRRQLSFVKVAAHIAVSRCIDINGKSGQRRILYFHESVFYDFIVFFGRKFLPNRNIHYPYFLRGYIFHRFSYCITGDHGFFERFRRLLQHNIEFGRLHRFLLGNAAYIREHECIACIGADSILSVSIGQCSVSGSFYKYTAAYYDGTIFFCRHLSFYSYRFCAGRRH